MTRTLGINRQVRQANRLLLKSSSARRFCQEMFLSFMGSSLLNWLGAISILFFQNYQRDATENSDRRQYQAQCYGLTEENDATQGRNDRNTELYCCSIGGFQRR